VEAERPVWDEVFAAELVGSLVLVGITHEDPAGPRQEQFHGVVEAADPERGITLRLRGSRDGDLYYLPPDLRSFAPAAPGSYRLRSTGEVLIDPDFTTSWTINPPVH